MVVMVKQLVTGVNRRVNGDRNTRRSITVHETGNSGRGANAQAHAKLQARAGMGAISWHWTVDDTRAIQSYEHTAQCRHAGNDAGNNGSIGVEICVNSDGDYSKAVQNAAELVAHIKRTENISDVRQHYTWWGKNCPQRLRRGDAGGWSGFLARVGGATYTPPSQPVDWYALALIQARQIRNNQRDYYIRSGMIIYIPDGSVDGRYPILVNGFTVIGLNTENLKRHQDAGIPQVVVTDDVWSAVVQNANLLLTP